MPGAAGGGIRDSWRPYLGQLVTLDGSDAVGSAAQNMRDLTNTVVVRSLRSLVLDTFDRLSAPVEHRYVWSDLAPWFAESGLVVDARRGESGSFVVARRPAR